MLREMSEKFSEKSKRRKSYEMFNNGLVGITAVLGVGPVEEWALEELFFSSSKLGLLGLENISKQPIIIIYLAGKIINIIVFWR